MFGKSKEKSETPADIRDILSGDPNIDVIMEHPGIISATTLNYKFPEHEGRELRPGHSIACVIPEEFRKRMVRDVILQHRKAEKYRMGSKEHDPHGAYSRVELHDQKTEEWRQWSDPKGYSPDKYAEWRSAEDPENEVLHDWLAVVGKIYPDAVKVTNMGDDSKYSVSQIHCVEIAFYPELEGAGYKERIYTPGTEFIDIENDKLLPKYGGGSHTEGKYENAIPLNEKKNTLYAVSYDPGPEAALENGKLAVDLEEGKELVQIEVAVGDTEYLSEINPRTGRRTRLGWAKLWVGIRRSDGKTDWFIQNANVPPQGVIAGGPVEGKIGPGDKLVIESRADTSFVMGWRIAYKDSGETSE